MGGFFNWSYDSLINAALSRNLLTLEFETFDQILNDHKGESTAGFNTFISKEYRMVGVNYKEKRNMSCVYERM